MEFDKSLVFEGYRKDDLYMVDFSAGPQMAICLLAKASECCHWHQRLGHAGMKNLHTLAKKKHVVGTEGVKFKKDCRCQNRRISGRGSQTVCLGGWKQETRDTMFYPSSGPLDGGKTLRPA